MPKILGNFLSTSTSNTTGDAPQKTNPLKFIGIIFVICLTVGLLVGYMASSPFDKLTPIDTVLTQTPTKKKNSFEGIVTYVEPFMYIEDNIKYSLVDSLGNEVILLIAKDQKLEVSEGHFVQVTGSLKKLKGGKGEYLEVENLIVKNATN
ncbi:hypothetical protein HYV31_00700 [candidate division WWE3 bacterium]|nr:hypothetical protein [candidate division WWE3 bacterium]